VQLNYQVKIFSSIFILFLAGLLFFVFAKPNTSSLPSNNEYFHQHRVILRRLDDQQIGSACAISLGSSHIQGLNLEALGGICGNSRVLNFGIGGDTTYGLLEIKYTQLIPKNWSSRSINIFKSCVQACLTVNTFHLIAL